MSLPEKTNLHRERETRLQKSGQRPKRREKNLLFGLPGPRGAVR